MRTLVATLGVFLALSTWAWSAVGRACVGDCDGNGMVAIDELVKGVTIALGARSVGQCLAFDVDANQAVTVDELVAAVNAALTQCPAPLPTLSATLTPTGAATPTP